MVDVGGKEVTQREAKAEAFVKMQPETLELIVSGNAPKGDVLAVARIAGIQAAKRTHELIPLCHALPLSAVHVEFEPLGKGQLRIETTARCDGKTLPIRKGDSLLLHPGSEHVIENTGAGKLYCLTVMTPNEGFAELIRGGEPVEIEADDIAVLRGRDQADQR